METKVLFEIPVYSVSNEKHQDYWEKQRETLDILGKAQGRSKDEIENGKYYLFRPRSLWKYNKIIGYIEIRIGRDDIEAKVYKVMHIKRYQMVSDKRYYLEEIQSVGNHRRIYKKSNTEIEAEIRILLDEVSKHYFSGMYIDHETFDNISNTIDYNAIIESLNHSIENA